MKHLAAIHRSRPPHWVGDGFFVRSAFTYDDLARELSPFLLLDYGAPREFPPNSARRGVGPHPHRGFETVTIAYQGEVEHRDSSGGGGVIGPGDVQWMTAADGIVHEEFHSEAFARSGGVLEMVQLWVNLPAEHKRAPARYQALLASQIPVVALAGDSGSVSVIAGSFGGARGPAQTFTEIELWTVRLGAAQTTELPLAAGFTSALFVLEGELTFSDGRSALPGDLALFSREGAGVALEAKAAARFLVMSGAPIDEPIVGYGPFVMNNSAEIRRAIEDFQAGRMGALRAR